MSWIDPQIFWNDSIMPFVRSSIMIVKQPSVNCLNLSKRRHFEKNCKYLEKNCLEYISYIVLKIWNTESYFIKKKRTCDILGTILFFIYKKRIWFILSRPYLILESENRGLTRIKLLFRISPIYGEILLQIYIISCHISVNCGIYSIFH